MHVRKGIMWTQSPNNVLSLVQYLTVKSVTSISITVVKSVRMAIPTTYSFSVLLASLKIVLNVTPKDASNAK